MAYLIFILVSLLLLGGFFALTEYETRRGIRFLAEERTRFDGRVERIEFILTHVDLGAFLRDEARHWISRVIHDVAHLSLQFVRAMERLLTRIVIRLRARNAADAVPRGNVREFVKTLSEFKGQLKGTHPEVTDIT